MFFPLAHDEEGIPLEVPAAATGWLVRRHAGGRGRPGAVYDPDGRPLVVALDATAGELRALGCKPGTYRLDAVDGNRRPLGVTGYSEVVSDGEAGNGEGLPPGDAAVMALARAVEAMQRVQAERERVQAEMFAKLIERLSPPPQQPALDLRNAVTQVLDLQKSLREAMASDDDDREEGGAEPVAENWWSSPVIAQMMGAVLPALMRWMTGDGGRAAAPRTLPRNRPPRPAPLADAGGTETRPAAEAACSAPGPVADDAARVPTGAEPAGAAVAATGAEPAAAAVAAQAVAAEATGGGGKLGAKVEAVLASLEPEERAQVLAALPLLPDAVRAQVDAAIGSMSADAAANALREYLAVARRAGGAS